VDPIALTAGHAIGVVLVINAVAKATQKDHVQEDGGIIAEIDGIMYVLKDKGLE